MSKLRKSARGQDCYIRVPGYCNFNPETTVLCHIGGGGMGRKEDDEFGAFGCSNCHDVVDHRIKTEYNADLIKLWHMEGVLRTWKWWKRNGYGKYLLNN